MNIVTMESYFDYQMKNLMHDMKENLIDMDILQDDEELTDEILWKNKELLGELIYNKIYEQIGFEEVGVVEL